MRPIFFMRHSERLLVALDDLAPAEALGMIDALLPQVHRFKVGLPLLLAGGSAWREALSQRPVELLLDLGIHDLPSLAHAAAAHATTPQALFLTAQIAGGPAMLRAVADGARAAAERQGIEPPRIIGTRLRTSVAPAPAARTTPAEAADQPEAAASAQACIDAGLDGLVLAPSDLPALRDAAPPGFLRICPGIRLDTGSPCWHEATGSACEHLTPTSPVRALQAGATMLVVGRPITQAADPSAALRHILREMEEAFMIA